MSHTVDLGVASPAAIVLRHRRPPQPRTHVDSGPPRSWAQCALSLFFLSRPFSLVARFFSRPFFFPRFFFAVRTAFYGADEKDGRASRFCFEAPAKKKRMMTVQCWSLESLYSLDHAAHSVLVPTVDARAPRRRRHTIHCILDVSYILGQQGGRRNTPRQRHPTVFFPAFFAHKTANPALRPPATYRAAKTVPNHGEKKKRVGSTPKTHRERERETEPDTDAAQTHDRTRERAKGKKKKKAAAQRVWKGGERGKKKREWGAESGIEGADGIDNHDAR